MKYQNILIPTDGSKSNQEVIRFICSIQKVTGSNILVVFVIEVPRNLPLDANLPVKTEQAKEVLKEVANIAEEYQARVDTSIIYARSAEEAIIATADDHQCDVIAISQDDHRLSIFANKASTIYQKAKCSVWLFNNKSDSKGRTL
ncbi:MAG: universal stress protein [Bacillota bacterium]